jgi:hypothetical protein
MTEAELARARRILEEIPGEHRRHQLSELLMELGRLPEVPDCTVLLPLVPHKWWDVRQAAISALAKCRPDPRIESALLDLLAETEDNYDRISANAALGDCGSARAIPALAGQIHHRMDDVKCSAIFALAKLGDASVLPVFLDALTDRSVTARHYAMLAIDQHGTQDAVGPLCERVRVILARRRRAAGPELLQCLQFLARFCGDEQAEATLSWVRRNRLDYLTPHEATWIRTLIPT